MRAGDAARVGSIGKLMSISDRLTWMDRRQGSGFSMLSTGSAAFAGRRCSDPAGGGFVAGVGPARLLWTRASVVGIVLPVDGLSHVWSVVATWPRATDMPATDDR